MNRIVPRTEIERFTGMMAEKRRRIAKAEHQTRGYRDEHGEWRGGLLSFVKYFWHVLEPGTPFVDGWPLECLAEHLEAVTFGEIVNLLMNIFPGAMKSLITNVFWPAFEWGPMKMPHIRYVTFSYSSSLTERDNGKFKDLITSPEYQAMYGDIVQPRQVGFTKVSNFKHGWKLASSVGGVGTGQRGDRIICLPGNAMIFTSCGLLRIGDIVQSKLDVAVAGFNHATDIIEWQQIEAYEQNSSGELIEIKHEAGVLRCTIDHPIFISGRGYVRADSIQEKEIIRTIGAETMQAMWDDHASQAKSRSQADLLQQKVHEFGRKSGSCSEQQQAMRGLWQDGLCTPSPSCAAQGSVLLRPQVPWDTQSRSKQSSVSDWPVCIHLQTMWKYISSKEQRGRQSQRRLLLAQMLHSIQVGYGAVKTAAAKDLRSLWKAIQALHDREQILFQGVRQHGPFNESEGFWQRSLRSWRGIVAIPPWMEHSVQGHDTRARREQVPSMFSDQKGKSGDTSCAPHRLYEGQSGPKEPDYGMQVLPRINARGEGVPNGLDGKAVISVKRIGPIAETFNIRVRECHNYFADGVLVHNCDDGNNVKESESQVVLEETNRWFRESMSSRLNNMETGAKIIISQRVAENDISGTILELGLPYCHVLVPMEFVWQADENGDPYTTQIGWVDPRWRPDPADCEGELAWPERFSENVVQSLKKELGPYATAAQLQQTPEARGGGIFKRDWWQPAEPVMMNDGQKFPPFTYLVASLDGAYTEKEENDPSALTVWGIFENEYGYNRVMLVHAWRKKLAFSGPRVEVLPNEHEMVWRKRAMPHWGLIEWTADTCKRFKVDRLLIEAKATGISAAQSLRNSHGREGWDIQLVEPIGDKVARAIAVQPSFSQEMVYAPDREWADMVIDEMAVFPKGRYKDLTDSTTQAIKHLRDNGLIRSDEERRAQELEAVRHRGAPRKPLYPGMRARSA